MTAKKQLANSTPTSAKDSGGKPTPDRSEQPTDRGEGGAPVIPSDPVIVIGDPLSVQPVFSQVPAEEFSYWVDGFEFKAGDNVVDQSWVDQHTADRDWLYGLRTGILSVAAKPAKPTASEI